MALVVCCIFDKNAYSTEVRLHTRDRAPQHVDVKQVITMSSVWRKPGDQWILGAHRVFCGASTVMTDVEKLMGGQLADIAAMYPHYKVDYGNGAKDKMHGKSRRIHTDAIGERFYQFLYDTGVNVLMGTKGACYICMSSPELHTQQKAFTDAGSKWATFIIWAKNSFTLGRAASRKRTRMATLHYEKRPESYLQAHL